MNKKCYTGVPKGVLDHYKKMVNGYTLERNGVLYKYKEWSIEDEQTMERILTNVEITKNNTWNKVSSIFPEEKDQINLFDAAWIARINYDHYRFKDVSLGIRKKNIAKGLLIEINKKTEELLEVLNNFSELGYHSIRFPDLNILQPELYSELILLKERTNLFDLSRISDSEFINSAISSQDKDSKREHLRGFFKILIDNGLDISRKGFIAISVEIANAVLLEPVVADDAYKARAATDSPKKR